MLFASRHKHSYAGLQLLLTIFEFDASLALHHKYLVFVRMVAITAFTAGRDFYIAKLEILGSDLVCQHPVNLVTGFANAHYVIIYISQIHSYFLQPRFLGLTISDIESIISSPVDGATIETAAHTEIGGGIESQVSLINPGRSCFGANSHCHVLQGQSRTFTGKTP